jgi:hypothetical protein
LWVLFSFKFGCLGISRGWSAKMYGSRGIYRKCKLKYGFPRPSEQDLWKMIQITT